MNYDPSGQVVCVGLLTLDIVQTVDAVPEANQKTHAKSLQIDFGGPAANSAATAHALGSHAHLVSYLGNGLLAKETLTAVKQNGMTFQALSVSAGTNGGIDVPISTVLVTEATGDRAIVSSHNLVGCDVALTESVIQDNTRVLLVDGHYLEAAIQASRQAQERAVPVVLDGGSWKPGMERLLPYVDVAILSNDFELPAGADDQEFLQMGCAVVARSNGPKPLVATNGEESLHVPVPSVEVLDTLGAGDVLHGAFAHYLASVVPRSEKELTWETTCAALKYAVRWASISCRYPGARGWIDVA